MLAYVFLYITVKKFIQCIFNLVGEEEEDDPQWANQTATLYLWVLFAPSPFFLSFGHPHSVNTTVLLPSNLTQFLLDFPPSPPLLSCVVFASIYSHTSPFSSCPLSQAFMLHAQLHLHWNGSVPVEFCDTNSYGQCTSSFWCAGCPGTFSS